ncbi:universal stress protein [Sedimentibacter sp. B4]|uniref:universal stress protein n=1 Tax=Sedimentibacter sp. B4 TaxID=304766 RepID=UPI0003125401|nr:universal stress protein [Sedimentibacter sp. B4]
MKQILLPIDGSKRSFKSIDLVKTLYKPDQVDVSIILVKEDEGIRSESDYKQIKEETMPFLDEVASKLEGFNVTKHVRVGDAGEEILKFAESDETDIIIMTKSTRKGWTQMIGSVTAHVVKYAKCIVMIIPE